MYDLETALSSCEVASRTPQILFMSMKEKIASAMRHLCVLDFLRRQYYDLDSDPVCLVMCVSLSDVKFLSCVANVWISVAEETTAETEPKFNHLTGVGRHLDVKLAKVEPSPASSLESKDKQPAVAAIGGQSAGESSAQSTNHQSQGKLVFGSSANCAPKDAQKVSFASHTGRIWIIFDSLFCTAY